MLVESTGEVLGETPLPFGNQPTLVLNQSEHITTSFGLSHGPRLCVCQAPNAFICVSGVAPPKHQMRLCVCHQMRLYVCHQMRLQNPQRSSLRSLTFARFARTFFNSLN